ncbi:TIGR03620 family F420-dependent LLM class oxidoreductase [Streptomyces sp. P1-3]|uniref:TIGR03620 family F420-dependent LLM class oxidoreductase n=1 Tax=Streptomyces sp. P1-3 TaxID=3421658 RepID=UPI003D35D29E
MRLGAVGIWSVAFTHGDRGEARDAAAELEELGYGTLWLGGRPGGNPGGDLVTTAELLAATGRVVVAPSCVNIWWLTADRLAAAYGGLPERDRARALLGLAVAHAPFSERYDRPYSTMCSYLDELDAAPRPLPPAARFVGAHRPRMTRLAAARAAGVQPYLVGSSHTARARELLGEGPLLAPIQTVVLHAGRADAQAARATARAAISPYLSLPNYVDTWLAAGFTEDDVAGGGSDRLVDELVVWGEPETIAARVTEHLEAGADHVALQVLGEDPDAFPRGAWRELRAVLPGG